MIRLLDGLVLLWLVTVLTFALIHLAPGDPATLLVAPTASAEEVAQQRARFGLDAPLPAQYGRWIGALLRGDLGNSLVSARPVVAIIGEAFPLSLALGGTSLCLSFVFGTLIGGWQARRASTAADTTISIASTIVYAAPSFWLALALVVLATSGASAVGAPAWLRLPAFGVESPGGMATGFDRLRDLVRHAILPLLVLSLPGAAGVARYARQSMREAAAAPHVAAATARGLSPARVERRYVLRTSLTPLVVLFGLTLPGVIAGSVFVEQVFAWPGLGRAMMGAIASRDYPVVLGLTVLYAATVIVANLCADMLLLWLDPRQRVADRAVRA
ncbi:MAG: ABC transporter permease [Gemmatimonadaceae bacterium]|nr:ABC transporter permease [Gemmatimonadaceae bacterium]